MKNINNAILSIIITLVIVIGSVKVGIMFTDSYTASCVEDKAKIETKRKVLNEFGSYYNILDSIGQDSVRRLYNIK